MMRRRRTRNRPFQKEEMALQITSMADIFTVLLVFLLKSFSMGVTNITPGENLILPEAQITDEVKEGLRVEVTPNAITVDGKLVTTLTNFAFEPTDTEANGTPRSLNTVLLQEYEKEMKRNPSSTDAAAAPAPTPSDSPEDHSRIVLMADQKTPYRTLKAVMASAANSGFSEYKLIVVEAQ